MRILLLGATGRTGRLVLSEALSRGHEVVALVRKPQRLADLSGNASDQHTSNLKIIIGTPESQQDIEAAFRAGPARPDAVLVTLKSSAAAVTLPTTPTSQGGSPLLMTMSIRNVLSSMQHHSTRKLVVMQSQATAEALPSINFMFRLIFKYTSMSIELGDHNAVAEEVRRTADETGAIDFVLARPSLLSDGGAAPVKVLGEDGAGAGWYERISRLSVARFLLDAAETNQYDGTAPVIMN